MFEARWIRRFAAVAAAAALTALGACGGDTGLSISNPAQCGGGDGPEIRGVVRMPNGRVAARGTGWDRLAAMLVARVEALTGSVSPVGRGVVVQLVELRPENVGGPDPAVLETATTNARGEFCIGLREGTDESVCRYTLQVGRRDDLTLTRAFVSGTGEAIDIDFRSEATVRVILGDGGAAGLCAFDPEEIRDVYQAVLDAPGRVDGADAEEVNAVAASLAAADTGVRAALVAGADRTATPPTATRPPQSTATATGPAPRATATRTGAAPTRSSRATRTLQPTAPTVTRPPAPTRTATPRPSGAATHTALAATATRAPTAPAATASRPASSSTPTPTVTPGGGAGMGDRILSIRGDSQYPPMPPNEPRTGYFSSGIGGFSASDRFSNGPLLLEAGTPNASGVAALRLKQDAYFRVNLPAANATLCVKLVAAGSSGSIDCDGGSAYDVDLAEAAGSTPPSAPISGRGLDAGAGAAQLNVMRAVAQIGNQCNETAGRCTITNTPCTRDGECVNDFDNTLPCGSTTSFPPPIAAVYTTASFLARKGAAEVRKSGEAFDCASWRTTDGPGMLVSGSVSFDAAGNSAVVTRLADR